MDIKKITEEMKLKIYNDEKFIQAKILKTVNYKIIVLDDVKLKVFHNGVIYRWFSKHKSFILKNPYWKIIDNTTNTTKNYNHIHLKNKIIMRHRIIAYCFLNFDINDEKNQIDHIDGNRINNDCSNLRIVNNQQNSFNRQNIKGYTYCKTYKKWRAKIILNKKPIELGYYNTPEEAHHAYLEGKKKYHVIQSS